MPARHALLIGINSYPLVEHANLRGCVNDVTLMASILEERFGFPAENLRVLRDEEATESSIRRAMDELEERLGEDDVAVFFYAGHGSRVLVRRDPKSFNESIVPHDSGRGSHPNRDIHDEEIDAWVQRLNAKTPHVTLILDCCHSVVLTRDAFGESGRGIAADERLTPVFQVAGAAPAVEVGGRQSVVLVAACQGHEQAYEYRVYEGGQVLRHGAMTYFLSRALSRTTGPVTWRQLFSTLQPALNAEYSRQHPQLWAASTRSSSGPGRCVRSRTCASWRSAKTKWSFQVGRLTESAKARSGESTRLIPPMPGRLPPACPSWPGYGSSPCPRQPPRAVLPKAVLPKALRSSWWASGRSSRSITCRLPR